MRDVENNGGGEGLKEISFIDDIQGVLSQDLIEIKKIIPLETSDENLMSNASKVFNIRDTYFVLDKKFSNLLVFNSSGKFLGNIGKLGRGPGEYQDLTDVVLDRDRELFVLYSQKDMSLFEYTLDGEFVRKVKLSFFGSSFSLIPNQGYGFYINYNKSDVSGDYNVLITNFNGEVKERWIEIPDEGYEIPSVQFSGGFKYYDNVGLYANALSDTIYQMDFSKNLTYPKYVLNFEGAEWPYGFNLLKLYEHDGLNYSYHTSFYLDSSYFFVGYIHKKYAKYLILDLHKGTVYSEYTTPDLLFKMLQMPKGKSDEGNYISAVTSQYYQSYENSYPKKWKDFVKSYPEYKKKLDVLNNEANPVLIEYSIKRTQ